MRLPDQVLRDGDGLLEEAAVAIAASLDLQVLDLGGDPRYLKHVERAIYEQLVRAVAEVEVPPYELWKQVREQIGAGR